MKNHRGSPDPAEQQFHDSCVRTIELWQQQLRLQDWDVKLEIKRFGDMDGSVGRCKIYKNDKVAYIELLHPMDLPQLPEHCQDLNEVIVHELLHIPLELVNDDPNTQQELALEQFINQQAALLCSLVNHSTT